MKITETKTVEREIHVAPCLMCGSDDISLDDCGYSSFNVGGGKCNKCKHSATDACHFDVTKDQLASIWNKKNDIPMLIAEQERIIVDAQSKIAQLKSTTIKKSNQE